MEGGTEGGTEGGQREGHHTHFQCSDEATLCIVMVESWKAIMPLPLGTIIEYHQNGKG